MEANIIVVFPRLDDAKNVKNILIKSGIKVSAVCNSGAVALSIADSLGSGILVSAYKLPDMLFSEIYECMPRGFEMLLVASRLKLAEAEAADIVKIAMPFVISDLIETVKMMSVAGVSRKGALKKHSRVRTKEEERILTLAKDILIERNGLTEDEAHKYIQKCSMDSGTNMIESAGMILSMYKDY